ncbi:hypothetical protein CBP33_04580 [Acidovorax carolinensis]|nr:hypothetical protein CBP33_04580 [Acidovorax carolinensis]
MRKIKRKPGPATGCGHPLRPVKSTENNIRLRHEAWNLHQVVGDTIMERAMHCHDGVTPLQAGITGTFNPLQEFQ